MKPKRSLYGKYLLVYLLFAFLSFWAIALAGSYVFNRSTRTHAIEELYREARQIASELSQSYAQNHRLDFSRLGTYSHVTGRRILLLSPDFTVLYDSESSALTGQCFVHFDPADSEKYYREGNFYGAFHEPQLSVFTTLISGLQPLGYVTLHEPLENSLALADRMLGQAYVIFALIFGLSLFLLFFLYLLVLKPLDEITKGAIEYAHGNLEYQIPLKTQDEMGYLAGTLNLMAGELRSANDYQKKFISNVSHDFRSPLTSIRGYIQAMLDGVIPAGMQEKYLQIVVEETDRLTKLTQNMLSLNSLDEKKMHLDLTDFDIVDLVKHCCRSFEGTCLPRRISFDLQFTQPILYVHADQGRIQQVIYNLLDNAIKFSPDGSSIRLRLTELGDKIAVSVKDYGIGIPKEDLNKIWTRFYKSDHSRGKDKKGTGLGLSIVKEALKAHGETIDVTSTVGSGTKFTFRLPRAGADKDKE